MPFRIPFQLEPPAPLTATQWAIELSLGFVILAFIVGKYIAPMLVGIMAERRRAIAEAAQQVDETLRDVKTLRSDYQQRLENIEDETEQRMAQAVEEAQTLRAQILAEAEDQAREIVQRGEAGIERERAKVTVRLHREFVDDVVGAAAYAMERSIDEQLQQRLVADFVTRVRMEA
jgi:F-type H+-transporting ATPase subunit b